MPRSSQRRAFTLIELITPLRPSHFVSRDYAGRVNLAKNNKRPAFTLIELIIVVAIIAIVVGATFVAINPQARLTDARESRAASDALAIDKAIQLYIADNVGTSPIGNPAAYFVSHSSAGAAPICDHGTTTSSTTCISLDPLVQAHYLPRIPDVQGTDAVVSGFLYQHHAGGTYAGSVTAIDSSASSTSTSSSASSSSVTQYALDIPLNAGVTTAGSATNGSAFDLTMTSPFSISVWVQPDVLPLQQQFVTPIVGKIGNGPELPGYALTFFNLDGTVYPGIAFLQDASQDPPVVKAANGSVTVTAGTVYHFVVTSDGAGVVRLYVNGAETQLTSILDSTITSIDNASPFAAGAFPPELGSYDGRLDDLRFYAAPLSLSDVQTLHSGGNVTANLIGRWDFDGTGDDTGPSGAYDATLNGTSFVAPIAP